MMQKWVQAAVVAGVALTAAASAQQPAGIFAGIYTSGQAKQGKAIFEKSCSNCHNQDLKGSVRGPALRGETFLTNWLNTSVNTLYSKIRFSMPATYPDSVPDEEKLLVLAYLFEVNGFPAGSVELKPDEQILDRIQIVKQGATEIPNFALVRVTGCLDGGPGRNWTLRNASDPAVTREDEAGSGPQALGTKTFVLVSAGAFSSDLHEGARVEARGLLYVEPGESRLNVTALQTVSSACGN